MSTVVSQQLLKEDGEDDDEEQGEEFEFDDSTDEDKLQEDSKTVIDCVKPVQASKHEDNVTSGSVSQTFTDSTLLPTTSPSAGPDGVATKDPVSVSTTGN